MLHLEQGVQLCRRCDVVLLPHEGDGGIYNDNIGRRGGAAVVQLLSHFEGLGAQGYGCTRVGGGGRKMAEQKDKTVQRRRRKRTILREGGVEPGEPLLRGSCGHARPEHPRVIVNLMQRVGSYFHSAC